MKHISITYHMYRDYPRKETAETCITLPMVKVIADDVLKNGADSKYLFPRTLDDDLCVVPGGVVYEALCRLSEMQGYRYEGFCTAEEVCQVGEKEVPLRERFLVRFSDDSRSCDHNFRLAELTLGELQALCIEATHILNCRAAGKASMANGHYDSPFRISDVAKETSNQLMVTMYDDQLETLISAARAGMKQTYGTNQ